MGERERFGEESNIEANHLRPENARTTCRRLFFIFVSATIFLYNSSTLLPYSFSIYINLSSTTSSAMAATGPSPLPPTEILSSKPISQQAAHDFLAAYFERANIDPAYQPSAGISEHGPVSRSTAAAPNLILHNLKRVQAGLAGEVLGRDLSLANLNGESADATLQTKNAPAGEGDWEDAKKFELEAFVPVQDEDPTPNMDVDAAEPAQDGAIDKEERKRKKKERRLAEKKAKAKAEAA